MSKVSTASCRRLTAWTGTALLVTLVSFSANASPLYTFTSFAGPGDNAGGTTVNGINNTGDVVGFSSNAAGTVLTNFIRNPNGTFNTLNINNDPLAMANGISDAGKVVGTSNGNAVTLSGGIPTPLPPVNGVTTSQAAFGINPLGSLIVGQYADGGTGITPGYLYNGSSYQILNPVASALVTNAQGVNNNGLVAGFYSADGVHQHGFFYNSVTGTYTLAADPTIANLVLTQFLGINDKGMAAGYYQLIDGSQHGFLYNIATGQYTFVDDPLAAKTGLSITQITGLNDSGEITGFYVNADGTQLGFVATPAVPEPSTWAMMVAGFIGLGFLAHRRRTTPPLLAA